MKKNIKNKKHGFTLVELLVVIAILAILASVTTVGYLSFTTRAKNSNALTELTEAREIIRSNLLAGDNDTYYYESDTLYVIYSSTINSNDNAGLKLEQDLVNEKGIFSDLTDLKGTFYFNLEKVTTEGTTYGYFKVTTLEYVSSSEGHAYWSAGSDIVAGQSGYTFIYDTTKVVAEIADSKAETSTDNTISAEV